MSELTMKQLEQDTKIKYRYIVWVGCVDDYYVNYNEAKKDYDKWIDQGYDEVVIEEIEN